MLKHLLIGAALITGAAVTSNNNQFIAAAEEITSVTSEATSEETSEVTSLKETNIRIVPTKIEIGDYYTCSEGSLDNIYDGDLSTYAWLCPNVSFEVNSRYMYFYFDEIFDLGKIIIHSGSEDNPSDIVNSGAVCFTNTSGGNGGTHDVFENNTDFELNLDFDNGPYDCTSIFFRGLKGLDASSWILINEIEFYKKELVSEPIVEEDLVAPVIEAPNKILKSSGITLTAADITKMVKVSDDIDEEVDLKLAKDSYTGNADKKGEYEMIYTATDDAGNKTTHKIAIEVANIPSCYVVNNEIFRVQSNQVFTEDDLLTVLDFTEDIPAGATSVNIECEEYLFNASYNEPGDYEVTVSARYSDGRELSVERTIEVFESEEESKSSSNWFVSAWNWIYNTIIKNVANFFISVWNGICEMFNWQDATGNYLDDIE